MRTAVTLEADTEALLRRAMRERGVSLKQGLNDAIRAGLAPRQDDAGPAVALPTYALHMRHNAAVDPDRVFAKALGAAAALEDDERVRKLRLPLLEGD